MAFVPPGSIPLGATLAGSAPAELAPQPATASAVAEPAPQPATASAVADPSVRPQAPAQVAADPSVRPQAPARVEGSREQAPRRGSDRRESLPSATLPTPDPVTHLQPAPAVHLSPGDASPASRSDAAGAVPPDVMGAGAQGAAAADRVPARNAFARADPNNGDLPADGRSGCTAAQLRRFIKSRAYVPLHELRRRFELNGDEDDVSPIELADRRLYVGLPHREARLLGELLEAGDVGYELLLDPASPLVVGVFPMRPVPRG